MFKRTYVGCWTTADGDCITYTVKAKNKDQAWRLLVKWAYRHSSMIKYPLDVYIEKAVQFHIMTALKKIALVASVLLMLGGFLLAHFNDSMSMAQIVPQVITAAVLLLIGFGIFYKVGGKYYVQ